MNKLTSGSAKLNALLAGLRDVQWYVDGDLIFWRADRAKTTLGGELVRIFGGDVDIQEGGERSLEPFYVGRQKLDALFAPWGLAVEIVRSLHGNSDRTKLRIFINEAIKPVAEARSATYVGYETMVFHYFEPDKRDRLRHALEGCAGAARNLGDLGSLFGIRPRPVHVSISELLEFSVRAASSGDSKDAKYWGEVQRRAWALQERRAATLEFVPLASWNGEGGLPGAVLVQVKAV